MTKNVQQNLTPTLQNSCDFCYVQKKKCDKLLPSCSTCLDFKKECKRERVFRQRKAKNRDFSQLTKKFAFTANEKEVSSVPDKIAFTNECTNTCETSTSNENDSKIILKYKVGYALDKNKRQKNKNENTVRNERKVNFPFFSYNSVSYNPSPGVNLPHLQEINQDYYSFNNKLDLSLTTTDVTNTLATTNSSVSSILTHRELIGEFYRVIKAPANRNWKRYLMNVVFNLPNSPNPNQSELHLFLQFAKESNTLTSFNPLDFSNCYDITKTVPRIVNHSVLDHILNKAVNTHLELINPFMPLFNKELFHSKSRSRLLLSVLQASGIRFLPKRDLDALGCDANLISRYLQTLAHKELALNFHRPSLGMLQTLLTIHFSFPGGDDNRSKSNLAYSLLSSHCLALSMAYMLGLHLNPKRQHLSPVDIEERYLAYNAVKYMTCAHSWRMNIPSGSIPGISSRFKWEYDGTPRCDFPHGFMSRSSFIHKRINNPLALMSDALLLETWSFTKMQSLRNRIQLGQITSKELLASIHHLILCLRTGFCDLATKLGQPILKNAGHLKSDRVVSTRLLCYITIIYHSHVRAAGHMILHIYSDHDLPPSPTLLNPYKCSELTLALEASARVIELALISSSELSKDHFNSSNTEAASMMILPRIIPLAGLGLAFLARYLKFHPDPSSLAQLLQKGYFWLKTQIPLIEGSSNVNSITESDLSSKTCDIWARLHLTLAHHLISKLTSDSPDLASLLTID